MPMMPKMTCTMSAKGMDCMMMPTGMMGMEMLKMCCEHDEPDDGLRDADDDDVREYAVHGVHGMNGLGIDEALNRRAAGQLGSRQRLSKERLSARAVA